MKSLILIASLFASSAFATVGPALIDEMGDAQVQELEAKIDRIVAKQMGAQPKKLRIEWNKARCLEANTEMDPSVRLGVCTLEFSAFQIQGAVAMIKTPRGYDVRLIHFDIE